MPRLANAEAEADILLQRVGDVPVTPAADLRLLQRRTPELLREEPGRDRKEIRHRVDYPEHQQEQDLTEALD